MNAGILIDLQLSDKPFLSGSTRDAWFDQLPARVAFSSDDVVRTATPDIDWIFRSGVYFLVWRNRVCYVGQSTSIPSRLVQYQREGRPYDGVAAIVGLPRWALTEVEYAYIHAWEPAWNVERTRSGGLHDHRLLRETIAATNRASVMPYRVPLVTRGEMDWPSWKLQIRQCLREENEMA